MYFLFIPEVRLKVAGRFSDNAIWILKKVTRELLHKLVLYSFFYSHSKVLETRVTQHILRNAEPRATWHEQENNLDSRAAGYSLRLSLKNNHNNK